MLINVGGVIKMSNTSYADAGKERSSHHAR
jgi:hypothetical protein